MPVLHLNEGEIASLLTMPLAIEAVEAGLRKMALDEAFSPPRIRCQTDHTMLHVLPASAKSLGVIGLKMYTTNPKTGFLFHVAIYDAKTGAMIGLFQGDMIGRYRTGAASALATRELALPNADTLALYGTGRQATTQLLGICAVRPIRRVQVYSRKEENRERFVKEMANQVSAELVSMPTAEAAAYGAQIVATATAAREPFFVSSWLTPGMHLNVAGSNFMAKAEVDRATVASCEVIIIDSKEQGKMEAGDLAPAIDHHDLTWGDVHELGRLITRRAPGRTSPEQITLFKSLGIGLEDIAVAIKLYKLAKERGIGRMLDL